MSFYPINKDEAENLRQMFSSPAWSSYVKCVLHEVSLHKELALSTAYGPDAIEKFRFNQGIAQNLTRIVSGIVEEVDLLLSDPKTLDELDVDDSFDFSK